VGDSGAEIQVPEPKACEMRKSENILRASTSEQSTNKEKPAGLPAKLGPRASPRPAADKRGRGAFASTSTPTLPAPGGPGACGSAPGLSTPGKQSNEGSQGEAVCEALANPPPMKDGTGDTPSTVLRASRATEDCVVGDAASEVAGTANEEEIMLRRAETESHNAHADTPRDRDATVPDGQKRARRPKGRRDALKDRPLESVHDVHAADKDQSGGIQSKTGSKKKKKKRKRGHSAAETADGETSARKSKREDGERARLLQTKLEMEATGDELDTTGPLSPLHAADGAAGKAPNESSDCPDGDEKRSDAPMTTNGEDEEVEVEVEGEEVAGEERADWGRR
jgi:hypothetical protein